MSDCPKMMLCCWQDIKIQLLLAWVKNIKSLCFCETENLQIKKIPPPPPPTKESVLLNLLCVWIKSLLLVGVLCELWVEFRFGHDNNTPTSVSVHISREYPYSWLGYILAHFKECLVLIAYDLRVCLHTLETFFWKCASFKQSLLYLSSLCLSLCIRVLFSIIF